MKPDDRLAERYQDIFAEIERLSRVTEQFLDTELYRIYLATLWTNAVLEPQRAGLEGDELEAFYDLLNDHGRDILGGEEPLKDCFRYLLCSQGEQAMERLRLPAAHRAQLTRFGALMGITGPEFR
ncbi:MAG: hypothetical protein JJT88_17065 [Gammaproteobacteria bacterium]|nr:hypothetical protein [Gammaproteobacteria bacterium]